MAASTAMTIDDLAEVLHTPRHVGHLPVGTPVYVLQEGEILAVTSWHAFKPADGNDDGRAEFYGFVLHVEHSTGTYRRGENADGQA